MMRRLSALLALDKCELSKLGITSFNAQGKIKPFKQIMKEIWEKMEEAVNDSNRPG